MATPPQGNEQKFSTSDLFASAKVVGDAASSTFRQETDKVDKAKVADAAGDLLEAAKVYGKFEKTSIGGYIDKAEDYLHGYKSSPQSTKTTVQPHSSPAPEPAEKEEEEEKETEKEKEKVKAPPTEEVKKQEESSDHASGEEKTEGGGAGDYLKIAEGFINKSGGDKSEGGGVGGYMKMAGGFFKN